ncbi:MAG: CpsD/CapB family tyrosine-protein kinase [Raoultibacter sp.]|jgi:capsular exopolysaccharide synthesis family protein
MAKKKKQSSNQLEIQNAAKTLFANIRFMSVDDPIRSLVITSSVPNEGKSTISVNLAQAIATAGKRVLLVEADMRRRNLAAMLKTRSSAGLYAVLTEAVPLNAAVASTTTANLYFLDTEPNIPNPADLISSKRFSRLVDLLEKTYDYVIFDTPPVGTFVDAAILSTLADATVMAVRPGFTKRAELVTAYEQLQKANANVIGLCGTFVEGSGSEYYYAYYTNSGERVKQEAFKGSSSSGASRGTSKQQAYRSAPNSSATASAPASAPAAAQRGSRR